MSMSDIAIKMVHWVPSIINFKKRFLSRYSMKVSNTEIKEDPKCFKVEWDRIPTEESEWQ